MAVSLSTTTLGLAVGASALTVPLAAVTNVSVGQYLVVDSEAMAVSRIDGLWVTVRRGVGGTTSAAHASGATVTIANPDQLYSVDPEGVPPTPPLVTPWINLTTGTQWVVSGSTWVVTTSGGIAAGDVVGPASSTTGDVAAFSGTTGKLLVDGAKLAADLVTGPASVTTGKPAVFSGTTGKVIAASAGASAGPLTAITSITVVNGIVTAISGT